MNFSHRKQPYLKEGLVILLVAIIAIVYVYYPAPAAEIIPVMEVTKQLPQKQISFEPKQMKRVGLVKTTNVTLAVYQRPDGRYVIK